MAVQTKTIKKTGGDYSSITSWEAAAPTLGTDIWKGVISDNEEYNENVTLAASGSASATSYLWLTSDPANRHAGVAGTGHARVRGSTSGSHVFQFSMDWTRIDWLEIQQDTTGVSDEGIRINSGAPDCLIDYCIVWSDSAANDQDAFYVGNWDLASLAISNCIVYGWTRAGLDLQQFSTGAGRTIVATVDHCAFYGINNNDSDGGAIMVFSRHASDVITITVYNTWADTDNWEAYADGANNSHGAPDGSVTWNGTHNAKTYTGTAEIDGTNNTTNWQDATDGVVDTTKSTGAWIVVNSLTGGSEDLTLLDDAAGNIVASNGTNRQGSEPDSRQDFSVDIVGGVRPTSSVDIGPHQAGINQTITVNEVAETETAQVVGVGSHAEALAQPGLGAAWAGQGVKVEDFSIEAIFGQASAWGGAAVISTPAAADQTIGVSQAAETETAQQVSLDTDIVVAGETESAGIVGIKLGVVSALETETAPAVPPIVLGTAFVLQAGETETANPVLVLFDQIIAVGVAAENEAAPAVVNPAVGLGINPYQNSGLASVFLVSPARLQSTAGRNDKEVSFVGWFYQDTAAVAHQLRDDLTIIARDLQEVKITYDGEPGYNGTYYLRRVRVDSAKIGPGIYKYQIDAHYVGAL